MFRKKDAPVEKITHHVLHYKVSLFNKKKEKSVTISGTFEIPSKADFRKCVEALCNEGVCWSSSDSVSSDTFTTLDYDKETFAKMTSFFWYTEE